MDRTIKNILLLVLGMGFVVLLSGCEEPAAKLRGEGLALYNQDQYQPALEKFSQSLKYDEFDPRGNYYAGAIYLKLGKYEQAEYHLKLAWQADPGRPEVKEALTETLLREGKEDTALDFLERDAALTAKIINPRPIIDASKRTPNKEVELRMYQGKVNDRLRVAETYEIIGDMENAKINYNKAMQMAPGSTTVLLVAGQFFAKIGDQPTAAAAFRKAYNIDPSTPGLVDAMTKAGVSISGG